MKQLELTQELKDLILERVGPDTSLEGIAVFECITLNSLPLPGKRGTFWENAVATPLTLRQIADHINAGNTQPLIWDHILAGAPAGKVFQAGIDYTDNGEFELRTLFYVDATETELITKLNSGTVDEVSISFLPSQYLCSECSWDYLGEDSDPYANLYLRTCGNGHVVGTDGVHVRMVGLAPNGVTEISLVARGAADKPKIVGRSGSKLQPATAMRLAARGFEIDGLLCQASRGEQLTMNTDKLVADLVAAQTQVGVLEAAAKGHDSALSAATAHATELETQLSAAQADVTRLEAELATAQGESKTAEADAATTWLTASLTKLLTAAGKTAENLPADVAGLTAAIDAETKGLTALIPAGGASEGGASITDNNEDAPAVNLSAFKTAKR